MNAIHFLSWTTMALGCLTTLSPGGLVLHWKLDDTGTTFTEEVTGQTTTAAAVETVTTGQGALAPDGGASIALTDTDPGSYIDAGTVQSGGAYVAGSDADFMQINGWTVTGWAQITNTGLSDQIIVSSDWNSSTGWMMGTRNDAMVFDYGNQRLTSTTAGLADGTTYLFVARCDPTKTVFGGGVNAASISWWDGSTWTETQGLQNRQIRLQGLEIGSFGGGRELAGNIDDVRIYDHVLTQAEMSALAIPEPTVVVLLGLAGCGLGLNRRRSRHSSPD